MGSGDRYCRTHGKFWDPYESGCPACRDLKESTLEAIRASDYRRANPGEYECPHCRYISLRRMASRCPLCQGTVDDSYWKRVEARERTRDEEERARQLAWRRGEPSRRAVEKREARIRSWQIFYIWYFAYILPLLSIVTTIALQQETKPTWKPSWQDLMFVIPGLNWLICLVILLLGSVDAERRHLFVALVVYAAMGAAGWLLTEARRALL